MDTQTDLLTLLHETKAVSIWNHKTGPVFWYAASVPGPFYVNTELVIWPKLAEKLLADITTIIASTADVAARADKLNKAILAEYEKSEMYKRVIAAMVAKAKTEFPTGSYDLVSGGERRDWLFSIPFAREMGSRHAFLFKDGRIYSREEFKPGEKALHIADLINNAASYFDLWFPILSKAQLQCAGTLVVNSRGSNGITRLQEHGTKTVAINAVDTGFFEKSLTSGLIEKDTLTEIALYFKSPQEWAGEYLFKNPALFDTSHIDEKSFKRMQSFFRDDPWQLRDNHKSFFAAMDAEIASRLKAA